MATAIATNPDALLIAGVIYTGLAVDHTTVDLTDAVQLGRFPAPPKVPFLAVDIVSVESDDDGPPIGKFEHTLTLFIEGWGQAIDTPTSAAYSGLILANKIIGALQNMHRDSGGTLKQYGVRRLNVSPVEVLNTEISGHKFAHFRAEIKLTYATVRGL